jgi:hypothetical protein
MLCEGRQAELETATENSAVVKDPRAQPGAATIAPLPGTGTLRNGRFLIGQD